MRPATLAQTIERIGAGSALEDALSEFLDDILSDGPAGPAARDAFGRTGADGAGASRRLGGCRCRVPGASIPPRSRSGMVLRRLSGISTGPGIHPRFKMKRLREYLSSRALQNSLAQHLHGRAAAAPRAGRLVGVGTGHADASMIIAIDGPAASGKGTLAKRLAAHYGLRHLDTGLLYRAVAKAVLDAGPPPDDRAAGDRGGEAARSRHASMRRR